MANSTKLQVMTFANLQKYDGLVKQYVDSACAVVDAKSIKTVALVNGVLNFYDVIEPVGSTTPKYSIELPKEDLSGLMEKLPSNVVAGTIVVADGSGNVKAASFTADEVALKADVNTAVNAVQADVNAIKDDYLKAADKTELAAKIKTNADAIAVLNGTGDGSVAKQVSDAVAGIVDGAPEAYDTLKEISDWIQAHPESVAALNSAIQANADAIDALEALVGTLPEDATAEDLVGYIAEVRTALEGKIATAKSEAIASATATAATDATTKANKALSDAKAYTDAEVAKDRARLDAAETAISANETSIKTNAEDIAKLNTSMTTVNNWVSQTAEPTMSTLKSDVDTLEEKVATLEANGYDDTEVRKLISTNASAITALQEKDTNLDGKISANTASINAVADRVTTAESEIDALQTSMAAVEKKASDNATNIASLKTTVQSNTDRIAALEANPVVEALTDAQIESLFAQA